MALKDIRAPKPLGTAAETLNRPNDFGIDFMRENLVNHFDCGLVRDSLALDKLGFEPRALHRARDSFATAVDHDWIDLNGLQKNNVTRHTGADLWIQRI